MKNMNIKFYSIILFLFIFAKNAMARCAVCVVEGMSGASIAVLVILTTLIFFLIANWCLKKYLNKN